MKYMLALILKQAVHGFPWLVEAPLQSLPPSSHGHPLLVNLSVQILLFT